MAGELRDAVRDGVGQIWALDRNGGLHTLDGGGHAHPFSSSNPEGETHALCLGRRANGNVLCLWHRDGQNYFCSEHRGKDSHALAPFLIDEGKEASDWHLTEDSTGGVWLTHAGPGIYRLRADGTAECLHRVTPDECLNPSGKAEPPTFTEWNPISVCEDGGGRIWFWTDRADCSSGNGTIRGALVFDGTAFVQHDFTVPGKGQVAITALAPKDAGHLWCARLFDGLYILDRATFQAERAPGQPREAFVTLRVLTDGRATWAVTYGRGGDQRECALWRLPDTDTGVGQNDLPACPWEMVVEPVDTRFDYQHQQDRAWGMARDGCFLGSNGHGLWFLPRDGSSPRALDWQRQFPLSTVRRFIEIGDGRWLGIGGDGQTWVGSPEDLLSAAGSPRARVVRTGSPLFPDDRGRLWNTFPNKGPSLREWTVDRWTEHRPPPPVPGRTHDNLTVLNTDAQGRVWMRADASVNGKQIMPVLLYDPAADRWQEFDDFDAALAAYAQEGSGAAFMEPPENGYDMPSFGDGGKVGYLRNTGRVVVFDGRQWRQWTFEEIAGQTKRQSFGPPFFNRAGRMCIDIDYQTWEANADLSAWKQIPYEAGYHERERVRHWEEYVPTFACPTRLTPDSAAQDNQGAWWVTSGNTLYHARDKWCVRAFTPGEPDPFIDGRRLERAFIDAHGNAVLFVKNDSGGYESVIVAPPGPPPRTTLTVLAGAAPDGRTARLATDAAPMGGRTHFRWQLDGRGWHDLDTDGSDAVFGLDALPGGAHRLEAYSVDAQLQTDAVPASAAFDIQVDAHAQMAGLIGQLDNPDYGRRKAALEALARQPKVALPALRAARERAAADDADRRWWIDAAIQQAESGR